MNNNLELITIPYNRNSKIIKDVDSAIEKYNEKILKLKNKQDL